MRKIFKGQVNPVWLVVGTFIVCMLLLLVIPMFASVGTDTAIQKLTGEGYVVFAGSEYADMVARLTSIANKADAAAINASAAAAYANTTLGVLRLHTENEVFLYPNVSSENVTFTAGGGADTFGAWVEINSSVGITLTSCFAGDAGYLSEIMTHNYSDADNVYIIEISYGGSNTVVGRVKVRSDWTYVLDLNSVKIPQGQTVYYRMQCETGGATLLADFRYYYD